MFILLHQDNFSSGDKNSSWVAHFILLFSYAPCSHCLKKNYIYNLCVYVCEKHYFKRINLENVWNVVYMSSCLRTQFTCPVYPQEPRKSFVLDFLVRMKAHCHKDRLVLGCCSRYWDIGQFDLHNSLCHWKTSTLRIT